VSEHEAVFGSLPAAFDAFVADPSGVGVFTDFDGTLSPIVDEPDAAAPLDGVVDALEDLAGRVARVAVISGRPPTALRGLAGRALRAVRPSVSRRR
jgi:trehalose 6-phosphate phosphatase